MTQQCLKMMSMNSNKRKGRMNSNSNRLGKSKYYGEKNNMASVAFLRFAHTVFIAPDDEGYYLLILRNTLSCLNFMQCDGIYGNLKMMYAATSLVGCVVQVQVQNGTIWEGVLRTFSKQVDIVLEMAHRIDPNCPPVKGVSSAVSNLIASFSVDGGYYEKLVFKFSDVVLMKACSIDTDFAVKDNFTDTAISKFNGQIKERELEPWEGAGSDSETSLSLNIEDDEGKNGWDVNDMFRTNAELYGVKSSYDNSLQDYTVPLTKKDTEEYKQQEARAMKIAQEIESNSSYQSRAQLENGDEEDKFSAVVRPDDAIPSKYVLPQKRRNVAGSKRQQTTPSPVHITSSKPFSVLHTATSNTPNQTKVYPTSLPLLERPQSPGSFPNVSPTQCSPGPALLQSSVPKNGAKTPVGEEIAGSESSKVASSIQNLENVPIVSGPPKMQVLCPQSLPPRIERRRENEKKMSKQKGRTDEIEEFKKFSTHFKLTEENKETGSPDEGFQSPDTKVDPSSSNSKNERIKIKDEDKVADVLKYSNLNPNAKEFVFNPNAKSFIPRSVSASTPQPSITVQPQRMQDQSTVMAVPHSQMIPSLPQPIFTAMAPQYVMQAAPVSVAITSPFGASPMPQTPRFRKVPITMQHRHDFTPSMHVAAATGQPILAQAAIPNPSQLTMQYSSPQGVITSAPPQQTVGYPQMNYIVGPRVVSPQPVGVIPTSPSVSYCDTSHLPTHLIMSAHPGVSHSSASNPHSLQQGQHSNHHPPQSQTPVLHPSPSPVHQVPNQHSNHSQPPTPTTVIYPGGGVVGQHPLQAAAHHSHSQSMSHPMHQHHHPGFHTGPQPVVLMQQQQVSASHHSHQAAAQHHQIHMHSIHAQNPGGHMGTAAHILPQMTIIPTSAAMTSAPSSITTPPFVQHT